VVEKEKHEEISTTDFRVIDDSKYKLWTLPLVLYISENLHHLFQPFSLSILLLVYGI